MRGYMFTITYAQYIRPKDLSYFIIISYHMLFFIFLHTQSVKILVVYTQWA